MTIKKALKEAQRRWGNRAYVEQRKQSVVSKYGDVLSGTHLVGRLAFGGFHVIGDGSSWEHAFAESTNHKL